MLTEFKPFVFLLRFLHLQGLLIKFQYCLGYNQNYKELFPFWICSNKQLQKQFSVFVLWGLSSHKKKKSWKNPNPTIPHSNQSSAIFTIKKQANIMLAMNCLVLLRCIILSQGSTYLGKQFYLICNHNQVMWFYLYRKSVWILFTNGLQQDVALYLG